VREDAPVLEMDCRVWYDLIVQLRDLERVSQASTVKEGLSMPHVISDECIMCGSCEAECPMEAISQGDTQFCIDPDVCIDCGACTAVCPVDAISEA
jgi:ferredoxin